MKNLIFISVLLAVFALSSNTASPQTFTDIGANIITGSSVAWGDYDNNGSLDLILTGTLGGPDNHIARLYRQNENGEFVFDQQASQQLIGVSSGDIAWGDYDNDNDLDLILTGIESVDNQIRSSRIYTNRIDENGSFELDNQASQNLVGVGVGSVDWGDYDNDGDLDIFLSGFDGVFTHAKIYRNDRDDNGAIIFNEELNAEFPGVWNSSAAWGDYDNDGNLDILMTGNNTLIGPLRLPQLTRIYRNEGGGRFELQRTLTGVSHSSVAWGDYDSDGYLDILLTGWNRDSGVSANVYRNNEGNGTFNATPLPGSVRGGSAAWGDYDNDGDLDFLLTGITELGGDHISKLYRNDNGVFNEDEGASSDLIDGVGSRSVSWGDYDNDGDLDLLLSGNPLSGDRTKIYRNNAETPNEPPLPPANLNAEVDEANLTVTLSWDAADDPQPNQGPLTYNLYLETEDGRVFVSPMADKATGFRRIAALGNTNHNTEWLIKGLEPGKNYRWGVQAIDHAYAASRFTEDQFRVPFFVEAMDLGPILNGTVAWADYDLDEDLDFLIMGMGLNPITSMYRNIFLAGQNNPFEIDQQASNDLAGNADSQSSIAWGDYDGDGDLDVVLMGDVGGGPGNPNRTNFYQNQMIPQGVLTFAENFLRNNPASQRDSYAVEGESAWGDYDNDGDLDLLVVGSAGGGVRPRQLTHLFENREGALILNADVSSIDENQPGILEAIWRGDVAWGDYDNDGDLDILLAGFAAGGGNITRIYRNIPNPAGGRTFEEPEGFNFTGFFNATVAWGDYDSDGDLDFAVGGDGGVHVYENLGVDFRLAKEISILGRLGTLAWGDYNNNGFLDLVMVTPSFDPGEETPSGVTFYEYNPSSRQLAENPSASQDFQDLGVYTIAWGDYDKDGDLDLILNRIFGGGRNVGTVYLNQGLVPNMPPDAPGGLNAVLAGNSVTLSWNATADDHTASDGLTYNLYIRAPDDNFVMPPMANLNSGFRHIVAMGNANHRREWTIMNLEPGNYSWGVQAIDTAFLGSPFAEGNFVIPEPEEARELVFEMELGEGVNLISIPLNPGTEWRLSDLVSHIGSAVSFIAWYDNAARHFVSYFPDFPKDSSANKKVEGGDGYLIVMVVPATVTFVGKGWSNTKPSAAPAKQSGTPVLVLDGLIYHDETHVRLNGVKVVVKNLRTGEVVSDVTGALGAAGAYTITFANLAGKSVVEVGDAIEISVFDEAGTAMMTPITSQLTAGDLRINRHTLDSLWVAPIPKKFALFNNYPNPFNPETWIPYQLPERTEVSIGIYAPSGRLIRNLELGEQPAGTYLSRAKAAYWEGNNSLGETVTSGVYFYVLKAGSFSATKKMVILK
ncbi:VCBS repeat-containing protein [Candidatus Poribacteria bacterium]|nr:VCBS repeat-containing protein [Candidatus Poribacteria bacterium]